MDYIPSLTKSIGTAMLLNIFKTIEIAAYYHIFKSKFTRISVNKNKMIKVDNFNYNRLKPTAELAYPPNNRPRGQDDLKSVRYHQKQLRLNKLIQPIWFVQKNGKLILLDGAHRLVAHHIEKRKTIDAYVIKI